MKTTYKQYEKYKDSGIDWLGEVPKHWEEKKLGAILEYKSVKNKPDLPVLSVYREYGVILKDSRDDNHNVTSSDTTNYKAVLPGDFVINKMKAWQGSMGVSNYEGIVSPAYITCKMKSKNVYSNFLHLLLRSNSYIGEYNRLSYGVRIGQWDMHMEDFKKIPIALPPLSEQQRIADFLDQKTSDIDKAIAQKEELIDLLNERKQILINKAVTRGLDENAPLKDSGVEWIGEIPEHWEVRKTTHIFDVIGSGTTPTSSNISYYEGGINWLQTGDLNDGVIINTKKCITTKAMLHFTTLKLYPKSSLVIAMYGATIGKVGLLDIECTTNQACCVLSSPISNVDMKFIFNWFIAAKGDIISKSYGGGQPNISQETIKALRITLPPLSEQQQISTFIEAQSTKIDQAIAQKEEEINLLKEYKSSLIDSAVRGKICLV